MGLRLWPGPRLWAGALWGRGYGPRLGARGSAAQATAMATDSGVRPCGYGYRPSLCAPGRCGPGYGYGHWAQAPACGYVPRLCALGSAARDIAMATGLRRRPAVMGPGYVPRGSAAPGSAAPGGNRLGRAAAAMRPRLWAGDYGAARKREMFSFRNFASAGLLAAPAV